MGRIFCLMGKSSSGKDTLYARLSEKLHFSTIVPYTTRPIREGEEEGREYHFITEKEVEEFEKQGRIIELRAYNTVHGVWKYPTFPYFCSVCITSSDCHADLPTRLLPRLPRDSIPASALPLRPHSSVILQYRNFNLLSIGYVFRPHLRPRLTQSRSALLWKPWVFGRKDSHLPLATHSGILSS